MTTPQPPQPRVPVTPTQWGAFVLAVLLLLLALKLHLLLALLSALATYSIYQALVTGLTPRLGRRIAEGFTFAFVIFCSATFAYFIYIGIHELAEAQRNGKLLQILESALLTVQQVEDWLPESLQGKLPRNSEDLRAFLHNWTEAHPDKLTHAGQFAGRAVAHLLIGLVIGFLAGNSPLEAGAGSSSSAFIAAWRARLQQLYHAFRDVVSAQLRISFVNTVLTALFLLVALPLFGFKVPLATALIVITFVAGLLPIVGNIISNTAITVVALTISPWVAIAALTFLISVHKLEYFINAKIMGHKLRVRTYELLGVMLLMEAAFGIGGLVAAPIYYAWLTRELRDLRIF